MASLSLSSRVSLQARFGSKASRRVAASRGVRASALFQKGRPALTMVMRVPSAKESEVDALFASHEAMMHATHVIGEAEADDIGHPRMLEYYVAKSTELSDPLDAASSPTGNLLYAVHERYMDSVGLKEHMRVGAEKWPNGFKTLVELFNEYGCFAQPNGVQLTTFADSADPCKTRKNDITLSLGICVPKSKEKELDALFFSHEKFMRSTHSYGDYANPIHDDLSSPRLTHFSVNKSFELVDPFDESEGFTGNVQYSIAETYVSAKGVEGHFSFKEEYPQVFESIISNFTNPEYAKFADVGNGRVVAAQHSVDFTSNIIGGIKKALDELLPRRAPHEEFCEDYCPEQW